jgi:hypothetical protein
MQPNAKQSQQFRRRWCWLLLLLLLRCPNRCRLGGRQLRLPLLLLLLLLLHRRRRLLRRRHGVPGHSAR